MKIIIGLGNPGKEYGNTRHNAGFMLADYLRQARRCSDWQTQIRLRALTCKNRDLILAKPLTYMNLSGEAAAATVRYYKLNPAADLLVAFDDLDMKMGSWKLQQGRGPHGHSGLESVYQSLGTADFLHLRLGVDNRNGSRLIPPRDYVLSQFTPDERGELARKFAEVEKELRENHGY